MGRIYPTSIRLTGGILKDSLTGLSGYYYGHQLKQHLVNTKCIQSLGLIYATEHLKKSKNENKNMKPIVSPIITQLRARSYLTLQLANSNEWFANKLISCTSFRQESKTVQIAALKKLCQQIVVLRALTGLVLPEDSGLVTKLSKPGLKSKLVQIFMQFGLILLAHKSNEEKHQTPVPGPIAKLQSETDVLKKSFDDYAFLNLLDQSFKLNLSQVHLISKQVLKNKPDEWRLKCTLNTDSQLTQTTNTSGKGNKKKLELFKFSAVNLLTLSNLQSKPKHGKSQLQTTALKHENNTSLHLSPTSFDPSSLASCLWEATSKGSARLRAKAGGIKSEVKKTKELINSKKHRAKNDNLNTCHILPDYLPKGVDISEINQPADCVLKPVFTKVYRFNRPDKLSLFISFTNLLPKHPNQAKIVVQRKTKQFTYNNNRSNTFQTKQSNSIGFKLRLFKDLINKQIKKPQNQRIPAPKYKNHHFRTLKLSSFFSSSNGITGEAAYMDCVTQSIEVYRLNHVARFALKLGKPNLGTLRPTVSIRL
jgi:hypothetical protein